MMLLRLLLVAFLAVGLQGCSNPFNKEELTSPCVGLDDSPCGPKRPVNDWWMDKQNS